MLAGRESEHKGALTYAKVIELARAAKGDDPEGDRAEFVKLVELARSLGRS